MKIYRLEVEKPVLGRRLKKPKINNRIVEKIGKSLYYIYSVKEFQIKVVLSSGSSISYNRCEEADEMETYRKKVTEDN